VRVFLGSSKKYGYYRALSFFLLRSRGMREFWIFSQTFQTQVKKSGYQAFLAQKKGYEYSMGEKYSPK
jgi:hypothetical protein